MSRPDHFTGSFDVSGIGWWPLVRCPAYPADPSQSIVATEEHAMLTIETLDPSGSQFYPIGLTLDEAQVLNARLRHVDIVLNGASAKFSRHENNRAGGGGDLLPTDENELDIFPGIAISHEEVISANVFDTILAFGAVFDGTLNGPIYSGTYPVENLDLIFQGFGTTIQGSVCAKFFGGKVYPFLYYSQNFISPVTGDLMLATNVDILPPLATSAFQLNVLRWGSVPLYLYGNPGETGDLLSDVVIQPHAGSDAYFAYNDGRGDKWNTTTGARL